MRETMEGKERGSHVSTPTMIAPVSDPRELLVRVDSNDRVIGHDSKAALHAGAGCLHRAFSVFLFDEHNRLLIHQRSALKPLWPGFWTNSCCSHPRRDEALESAARRRVREELGVAALAFEHVYRFEYHARYGDVGSEHELCHVFLARAPTGRSLSVHPEEVAALRWLDLPAVDRLVGGYQESPDNAEALTPWFVQEWTALRGEHSRVLARYLGLAQDPRDAA